MLTSELIVKWITLQVLYNLAFNDLYFKTFLWEMIPVNSQEWKNRCSTNKKENKSHERGLMLLPNPFNRSHIITLPSFFKTCNEIRKTFQCKWVITCIGKSF